ncbi:MAG: hypothetical protein ACKVP5_12825 [Aestuariivirga sp.]
MSADGIIAVLSEKGRFNPRQLDFHFPSEALDFLSVGARYFFRFLSETPGELSLDHFIRVEWLKDKEAVKAYRAMTPEERLEVHAIIGFVVHETTHKVDMLISPFGVQYLHLMIREYLILQNYLPRALDHPDYIEALRVLPKLTEPPKGLLDEEKDLSAHWNALTQVVRKTLAWGDLGSLRPPASQIVSGWSGGFLGEQDYFGTNTPIETITVLKSFMSFRPKAAGNWYLRPMTIFEAKALASTMLYILDISGDLSEVALYFRRVYLDHAGDLEPDYLFLLDTLAQIHGPEDFAAALESGNLAGVRHILLMASALGWFALQAPPVVPGVEGVSAVSGNPVMRLFVALFHLRGLLQNDGPPIANTAAALLMALEDQKMFSNLEQAPIASALDATRQALQMLREDVGKIWNPEVRKHFVRILDIVEPHIQCRSNTYDSALGMPDKGNPRGYVNSKADMELFYHDHAPDGAYAEWLEMRGALLFAHPIPHETMVAKLDQHFRAYLMAVICENCRIGLNQFWMSRFVEEFSFTCPNCGTKKQIHMDKARMISLPKN